MTGEIIQPSFDDVVAHYVICEKWLIFASSLGCHFIVTMAFSDLLRIGSSLRWQLLRQGLETEIYGERGGYLLQRQNRWEKQALLWAMARRENLRA